MTSAGKREGIESGSVGWWRALSSRARLGFVFYLLALAMMLGSLPVRFLIHEVGPSDATWRLLLLMGTMFVQETGAWLVDSAEEFVRGPLPAMAMLISYLFSIPGVLLIYLASRNRWACWLGRFLWIVVWLAGPLMFLLMIGDAMFTLGLGFVLWFGALTLLLIAHLVMAPARRRYHSPIVNPRPQR